MKQRLSYILAVLLVLSCFAFPASAVESSDDTGTDIDVSTDSAVSADSGTESSVDTSVDSSADISSDDPSSTDISSADPGETYNISFSVIDLDTLLSVSGMSFTLSNGKTCPSGGSTTVSESDNPISFTTTALDGKVITAVVLGNGIELTADAAGVYTIGTVSADTVITVHVRAKSTATVTVNVSNVNPSSAELGGVTDFDDSTQYYIGDTLTLTISPKMGAIDDGNINYGISSVSVNGVPREDVNVFGMEIELTVTENMTVDIVFARFYAVGLYVRTLDEDGEICNETGGYFRPTEIHENQVVGTVAYVLEGTDFRVKIERSRGYSIDRLMFGGEDGTNVTSDIKSGHYTIENISNNYTLFVFFEPSEELTYPITTIVSGTGGTVSPLGTVQVGESELHSIELIPDENYKVGTVTKDGEAIFITGTTIQVEADKAHTIVVTFVPLTEDNSSEDVSVDDSSEESSGEEDSDTMITVNDVNKAAVGDEVRIDISEKSFVGVDAIIRINELLAADKTVYIGVPDSYWWMIPAKTALPVPESSGGGLSGLDFKVSVNTGRKSDEMREAIQKMADQNNYKNAKNITIEREGSFKLPDEARLLVNVKSYFDVGQTLDWLKYDDLTDSFSAYYAANDGYLVSVGIDNWVELSMPQNNRYGLLVVNIDGSSTVTFEWNGNHCSLSVPCSFTEANGIRTGTFAWKDGKNLIINIVVRDGYSIESITSEQFGTQLSVSSSGVVLENGGKGGTGTVSVHINGISIDGKIIVKTAQTTNEDVKDSSNGVDWTTIVLIIVIAVAMIGGGVVFVLKWRQTEEDDDEDEEDAEFYEDDEDSEDY